MQAMESEAAEINWDDVLPRLILYSLRLIKSYHLEELITPEDVALSAIERGIRYSRGKPHIQNLNAFLMRVAKNIVIDTMRNEKMHKRRWEQVSLEDEQLRAEERMTRDLEHKELLDSLLQSVNDNAELRKLVKLLVEDPSLQSRELSERMGVPLGEVYRLKKQLQKRLQDRVSELAWKNNPTGKNRRSGERRLES